MPLFTFLSREPRYNNMPNNVETKGYTYSQLGDSHDESSSSHELVPSSTQRRKFHYLWTVLTVINTLVLGTNLMLLWQRHSISNPQQQVEEPLAPFMSSIDRTLHKKTFNAFEYNVTKYTARTSDVGDEVEKNWVDLGIYGAPIVIPMDEVEYFDISSDHVRLDPQTNPTAPYAGVSGKIQAQHYLHCVNLLRQGLWYNRDYYRAQRHPSWNEAQDVLYGEYTLSEIHTAHCIDQLRQLIMCEADMSVVPFLEGKEGMSYLDFERPKQCRSWQSFLKWHRERAWEGGRISEERNIPGHEIPFFSWSGH